MKSSRVMNRKPWAATLLLGLLAATFPASAEPIAFFSTNFDSGVPPEFDGITTIAPVQGWAGLGHGTNIFTGVMLHNDTGPYGSGPALPTRLTLTGLPPHDFLELHFLLAIIDTWDGNSGGCDPDLLTVTVDGQPVFSESFTNFPDTHTASYPSASTPPEVVLAQYYDLGFLDFEPDSAYDLGIEPSLQAIPHTANTVTIEWIAGGAGWQGSYDESWAIDNVEVIVSGPTPIERQSWGRVKTLFR